MFFFIAGIQPKTVTLDDQPRRCPSCGLYQAYLKRVNHYFSVFFIPVFKVKAGMPFLECQRCGRKYDENLSTITPDLHAGPEKHIKGACPYCGKTLAPGFRFCPFCGKAV